MQHSPDIHRAVSADGALTNVPGRSSAEGAWAQWVARLRLRNAVIARSLAGAVLLGFIIRVIAALTLSPHVDEPSSVLAANVVADRGLPVLPSGTPYFQGVTLSYLMQPFIWLGLGDIDDLQYMRMLLVIAGSVTLYFAYRLALAVTGNPWVGVVAATLIAIDPVSVQWSAHMRMYGLLQPLTVALAWAWMVFLRGNTSWAQIALVSGLYWAAVFTHVGASLLGPAMAVSAFIIWRWQMFRRARVMIALGLSAFGTLLLLVVNEIFSGANEPVSDTSILGWSFVGDNLLAPTTRLSSHPIGEWPGRLSAGITLYWLLPVTLVVLSTIIGARYLLRTHRHEEDMRVNVIAMMSLYWVPFLAVVLFTISPKVRYLVHLHVLGYLFVAVVIVSVLRPAIASADLARWSRIWRNGLVIGVVAAIVASLGWRLENPIVQPDYNQAMAYVVEHHEPGEPVIVTLPPVGYLTMEESDRGDVYFLAGSAGWTRAERYTRWASDGRLIDYWIGADSIVSTYTLDQMLDDFPNAWVIADRSRLENDWTAPLSIERVIRESMFPVFASDGGAVVYRTLPEEFQDPGPAALSPQSGSVVAGDDPCQGAAACPTGSATPIASPNAMPVATPGPGPEA